MTRPEGRTGPRQPLCLTHVKECPGRLSDNEVQRGGKEQSRGMDEQHGGEERVSAAL
jgi:hypothetical protein